MCCSSHGDSERKLLLIEHRSEKTSQISTLPDFPNESQMRIAKDRHNHATPTAEAHGKKKTRTNESESSLIPADWGGGGGEAACRAGSSDKRLEFGVLYSPSRTPPTDPGPREPEQIRRGEANWAAKSCGGRPRRTESWPGKEEKKMQPRVRARDAAHAGPNPTDQTKNGAMVGGRKEQGAWGPQVVAARASSDSDPAGDSFVEGIGDEEEKTKGEKRKG